MAVKRLGSDSLKGGWRQGLAPKQLSVEWTEAVRKLFFEGTGEEYFAGSMRGVLWTTPFKEQTIRIVSFVLDEGARGKGWGSVVWNLMADILLPKGITTVQLEVRASNQRAIMFYRERGLEIQQELHGYYRQGMGYMMRGKLQHYHPNNDTPEHEE